LFPTHRKKKTKGKNQRKKLAVIGGITADTILPIMKLKLQKRLAKANKM